jgi:hypothetical protein
VCNSSLAPLSAEVPSVSGLAARRMSGRPHSRKVNCEAFKIGKRAVSESTLVRRAHNNTRRVASLECLLPARGTEAPTVAGFQAREANGLKTLAACPLGFIRFAPISPPHRTSMLHSRRRDRPPAVLPKLHSASRKTLSPRRRVSITRPATATQPGLARAQWPPQHAHMIHPYGNPAFARPSRMR